MNDRYKLINCKLKEWSGQDKSILKTIYEHSNPEGFVIFSDGKKVSENTSFKNISNENLYQLFESNHFNDMNVYQIQDLFQEVHNRYIRSNGFEPSRNVVFDYDDKNSFWGYVNYSNNMLFINRSVAEKIYNKKSTRGKINKDNMGLAFFNIILHESRHLVQYDSFIKFLLDEPMSEEQKFLGAVAGLNNINFNIADSNEDNKYIPKWNSMYYYHYLEHDAYYTGLMQTKEILDDKFKDDLNYNKLLVSMSDKIGKVQSYLPTTKLKIESQVKNQEKYLKEQIKYFKEGAEDCPLKAKILETVESFMKVDDNGNSPFREKLTREVSQMQDCYTQSKNFVKENKEHLFC